MAGFLSGGTEIQDKETAVAKAVKQECTWPEDSTKMVKKHGTETRKDVRQGCGCVYVCVFEGPFANIRTSTLV